MPISVILLGLSIFFLITGIIEGNTARIIGGSFASVCVTVFALWLQYIKPTKNMKVKTNFWSTWWDFDINVLPVLCLSSYKYDEIPGLQIPSKRDYAVEIAWLFWHFEIELAWK